MAKEIWVTNSDFVPKKTPAIRIEQLKDKWFDVMKAAAERRMKFYDEQPKLVRQAIGELGCNTDLMKACAQDRRIKTTHKKIEIIRQKYANRLERMAVKI